MKSAFLFLVLCVMDFISCESLVGAILFALYVLFLFSSIFYELIHWTMETRRIIRSEDFAANPDRAFKRDKLAGAMLQCFAWSVVSCGILLALFIFGSDWRIKTAVAAIAIFFFIRAFVFCAREQKLQKEGLEEKLARYYAQHPPEEQ